MRKKLSLEALEVDSFTTTPDDAVERGTVHGHGGDAPQPTPPEYEAAAPCTCYASCLCRTAYYNCGTGPHTIHSCDFTYNQSCGYDTRAGCDTWQIYCA